MSRFVIDTHIKDMALLNMIQSFFGGIGSIVIRKSSSKVSYRINKIEDLYNIVIPHFDKYPLQSAKRIDFILWKKCIELIRAKAHLTENGLKEIISVKAAINLGLSDKVIKAFPHVKVIPRPEFVVNEGKLNPYWVSGFSEGDYINNN